MKKIIISLVSISSIIYSNSCRVPAKIAPYIVKSGLQNLSYISDVKRNYQNLSSLCLNLISFKEHNLTWKLLLITNPNRNSGLFWFLPHDNENSAFDAGIYAIKRYGGGLLAIVNSNKRYNAWQDPNRNFSYSREKLSSCKEQKAASPIYTNMIFSIIDYYKAPNLPYLALHNNTNKGGISILKSSPKVKSFLAYKKSQINSKNPLTDEDNLVYTAGLTNTPPNRVYRLLKSGLNVKYEVVNSNNNDCSMSNFVVIEKGVTNYYNIEAQHGKTYIQKVMIDRLIKSL